MSLAILTTLVVIITFILGFLLLLWGISLIKRDLSLGIVIAALGLTLSIGILALAARG